MFKQVLKVLKGSLFWNLFKLLNNVTYKVVVLVLTGENKKLDLYAVKYLEKFMARKGAKKAFIISVAFEPQIIEFVGENKNIFMKKMNSNKIKLLYDYYSFDVFFENIVFTYVSSPEENLLDRVLKETDVNEEDAVCLALYHLRCVYKLEEN